MLQSTGSQSDMTEQPQEYFYQRDFKAAAINGWDKIQSKPLFANISLKPAVSVYQVLGTSECSGEDNIPTSSDQDSSLMWSPSLCLHQHTQMAHSFIHSFPYCLYFLKYLPHEIWGGFSLCSSWGVTYRKWCWILRFRKVKTKLRERWSRVRPSRVGVKSLELWPSSCFHSVAIPAPSEISHFCSHLYRPSRDDAINIYEGPDSTLISYLWNMGFFFFFACFSQMCRIFHQSRLWHNCFATRHQLWSA